ncbi:MAG: hypothetical protein ABIB46_01105 [bacterium]
MLNFDIGKKNIVSIFLIFALIFSCIYIGWLIVNPPSIKFIFVSILVIFFFIFLLKLEIGIYFLVFLSPLLYFTPSFYIGPFRFWIEDILIVMILFLWLFKIALKKEFYEIPPLQTSIFVFIFFALLNIFISIIVFSYSFQEIINAIRIFMKEWVEYIILYLICFNLIKTKKQIKIVMASLLIGAFISVFILKFSKQGIMEGRMGGGLSDISDAYYSPNVFGLFCVIMISLCLFYFMYTTNIFKKVFFAILSIPFISLLIETASRSAFFCFIALFIIIFFVTKKKIIILGIPFLIWTYFHLPPDVMLRMKSTLELSKDIGYKENAMIINIFGKEFIPEGSTVLRLKYLLDLPSSIMTFFFCGLGYVEMPIDNNFFSILVHYGFFVLCFFVRILIIFGKKIKENINKTKDIFFKKINQNILTILIIISIFAFSSRAFTSPRISILFWILMAISMRSEDWCQENEQKNEIER